MVEMANPFIVLAATLLDALPPSLPISDVLLLQLHAIFGPMLLSALQLVDKREVVRVSLPADRYVYQVSSSSGKNYTIHLNPPPPTPVGPTTLPPSILPEIPPSVNLPPPSMGESIPRTPSPPPSQSFNPLLSSPARHSTPSPPSTAIKESGSLMEEAIAKSSHKNNKEFIKRERIMESADHLSSMYCPCAGWAYGCLAGEKTIMCKHLLAIIIASKTNRVVRAEVNLGGVAGLLDLA
ncbi:uncharacterized protein I303_106682 [Kwoniella dejecticola CBS 10117]|uniref:SWIM-type domain-containing protein n=1 Tax=Kwoniella dejecticola CBS 10117 TaxID=1296121 RepID=A0A1A5ZTZ5_9TREE|nr:uncharacterized protein I303_08675 [Kwoniella dejecticola CBS 10117]OBR81289.1 hypothetical protein I303_08675 [Kwoniella dejecticola CBS 10117]